MSKENKYHFAREVIFTLRSCHAISQEVYLHWIDKLIKDEGQDEPITNEKDARIADLEAKLAQAIEFQKRAFSYGRNGASWEEFFTAQEKEAQESEKGGL